MNKRVKRRWLAALRSGEYEQMTRKLRNTTPGGSPAYCCLGVLCDLYTKSAAGKKQGAVWEQDEEGFRMGNSAIYPSPAVEKWAKLKNHIELVYVGHMRTLDMLNDISGLSFKEIANMIEKQL